MQITDSIKERLVVQYNITGSYIKEWESAKVAALELNLQHSCINSVCNNRNGRKQHGGFIWKFKI